MSRSDPPLPASLVAAYDRCEEITRVQARNFSYGILLLPTQKRRALSAVYAFARRIDDIGDEPGGTTEAKLDALAAVRTQLVDIDVHGDDPVLVALADAADRLPIALPVFGELIDGVEADLRGARYSTVEELVHYCRCVAGSIGRLSLGAFGGPDDPVARERADALGVALQFTNILRDVREDLQGGRVYLPTEDLERFDLSLRLDDVGNIDAPRGPLAALVRFEAARARAWYAEGMRLLPVLDARSAACCAAMAGIYRRLLDRIADRPELALTRRTSLPTPEKVGVAVTSLTRAVIGSIRSPRGVGA